MNSKGNMHNIHIEFISLDSRLTADWNRKSSIDLVPNHGKVAFLLIITLNILYGSHGFGDGSFDSFRVSTIDDIDFFTVDPEVE